MGKGKVKRVVGIVGVVVAMSLSLATCNERAPWLPPGHYGIVQVHSGK